MFEKTQVDKKETRFGELNFSSLTRKYWKSQVFFYFITTLSCIISFIIDQNYRQLLFNKEAKLVLFGWSSRTSLPFSQFKEGAAGFVLLTVSLYFLVVFIHVWFALHLEGKVRRYLKKLVVRKMFKLEGLYDKQKVSPLLNYSVELFSRNVFYIPNQIYYAVVEIILTIIGSFLIDKKEASFDSTRSIRLLFSAYLLIFLSVCLVSQFLLYYLELWYHNSIENGVKEELFLVENGNLVIKKNKSSHFLKIYSRSLDSIFYRAIFRNLGETFSFVFPSYFLIKLFPFLCIYSSDFLNDHVKNSTLSLVGVFANIRKVTERGRDFPFYYSSQRKLNEFLFKRERDDGQNGQTIPDPIRSIKLKDISFTYQNEEGSQKKVLDDFSILFETGKVNEMNFPNGFGKSTIINLVTGMLKTQGGGILVNEIYNLANIDLKWWRENISYSEHRNLISRLDLSTGQKQLVDLDNAFKNKEKQVFIFDEADSNLDHKNRSEFMNRLGGLSRKKLVILVSHHSQK